MQQEQDKKAWRDFRDQLLANPAELSDPSKVTGDGFRRLHNLSEWLHRKTGQDYAIAVREWRLLEPAFSKEVAEAYRDGMKMLWRLSAPERPIRQPGAHITVKWITLCSYAAIGLEAVENAGFAKTLSDSEARRAIQHVCLSEQGYPDWLDGVIEARPKVAVPLVGDAFKEEWAAEELSVSYFLYHFAQNAVTIHSDLQNAIFDVIATVEPKQLQTVDRGLDIIRNLALSEAHRAALRGMAMARFRAHQKSQPAWAARYVALLFLVDGPSAATTLMRWLRGEKGGKRKALTITVLGLLFGSEPPAHRRHPRRNAGSGSQPTRCCSHTKRSDQTKITFAKALTRPTIAMTPRVGATPS